MFCEHVKRPYTKEDVKKLQGSVIVEHTIARNGANKFRKLLYGTSVVRALGALTGNQAMQMAKAGLKAIYVSGWQVAADGNVAGQMYPDQSLYPCNSVPELVKKINNTLIRADQIETAEGNNKVDYFLPIIADAEAGFGGSLSNFEIMKAMIEAGAAAVHFEDQLASEKKCGHLGGKVLIPTQQFIKNLVAARLAADVLDVPTVIIARTDAFSAKLITSNIDKYDHPHMDLENRTNEGYFPWKQGVESAISRGLAYAPYADLLWWETSEPNLEQAKQFADAIHAKYPGKLLAYNCSPSFNWKKKLTDAEIATFQQDLYELGYCYVFITLAGFHSLNLSMFNLAKDYNKTGMTAYSKLQEEEFAIEDEGYEAVRHQRECGTGYFDAVSQVITGGTGSMGTMEGSTEDEQF